MMRRKGLRRAWIRTLIAASLGSCLVGSCRTDTRDALYAGVFDFVSGAVTNAIATLIAESTGVNPLG